MIILIYFDNSATSGKKPQNVIMAVNYALNNLSANPGRGGHDLSLLSSSSVYNVRKKIATFFGANDPSCVAFCANCTTALNFVIKGLVQNGEHIVISDLEHNAVSRPVKSITNNYSIARVSFTDDEETIKSFEEKIKPETKLVICTSASNVFGKTLPLKKIGEICKKRNIPFAVDGAQGGGIIPLNMEEQGIDYLCLAPHKGLYSPMSTGILIAKRRIDRTIIEGGNGLESLNLIQSTDMPEGFESGTISVPNIIGIGAGVDFVNKTGREKIHKKEIDLIRKLYRNLQKNKNIILYTPLPSTDSFTPVLSFNVIGKHSEEVGSFLNKKGIAVRAGFHCSALAHKKMNTEKTGAVRVSTSIFSTESEIEYLSNIIKKI